MFNDIKVRRRRRNKPLNIDIADTNTTCEYAKKRGVINLEYSFFLYFGA